MAWRCTGDRARQWLGRAQVAMGLAVALVWFGVFPAQAAAAGATSGPALTFRFHVAAPAVAEKQRDVAVQKLRREAHAILNSPDGWALGGSVRFLRSSSARSDFSILLASPGAIAGFSPACSEHYSCRVGRRVFLNAQRWNESAPGFPSRAMYRRYLVQHEVGHWLGLEHRDCPAAGRKAPVMMQQSKALGPCRANARPSIDERRQLAKILGVVIRSSPNPPTAATRRAGNACPNPVPTRRGTRASPAHAT